MLISFFIAVYCNAMLPFPFKMYHVMLL